MRHKLPVLAAVLVFVALAGGLTVAFWQASIARREARTADTLQRFTEGLFRINSRSNPDPVKAQQTTARQLLDIGSKEVSTGLNGAPEAKVRMLEMLGSLYQELGLEDKGVELQRERVATLRKLSGNDSVELADALIDLASCMHASNSVNQSRASLLEAKAIWQKTTPAPISPKRRIWRASPLMCSVDGPRLRTMRRPYLQQPSPTFRQANSPTRTRR